MATAIVAGDALGVCRITAPLWLATMLALVAAALFMRGAVLAATAFAMLAIAAAVSMTARDAVAPPFAAHSIRNFSDGVEVTLEGRINQASQQYPDREYVFVDLERAGPTASSLRTTSGTVRLTVVGQHAHVRIGDEVRVAGVLRFARNFGDPGEFDYVGYLARQGIAATMVLNAHGREPLVVVGYRREFPASQIAAVRARIGAFFDRNLRPENAEMRALVIGDQGDIGDPLRQTFARTGMAHLLVISGLHLSIVAAAIFAAVRLAMMLFPGACQPRLCEQGRGARRDARGVRVCVDRRTSRIDGARARDGARLHDGRRDRSFARGARVAGARRDRDLRRTAGFDRRHRLSALVRVGDRNRARDEPIRRVVRTPQASRHAARRADPCRDGDCCEAGAGYLAVSFWAMAGTAPLTAYHFNQFAIVGVVANAAVVPIMAFGATISGLLAAALSFVSEPAARPVLLFGASALAAGNWLAAWFMNWPLAWFRIFTPTILELAVVYMLLLMWLLAAAGSADCQETLAR